MKSFNIYNINSSYIDQLVKIEKDCFADPWSYKSFNESFNNPYYLFFAAIDDNNNIIGYIGLYEILKQGYITNIAVYKSYRNIGIASSLLKTTIKHAEINNFNFLSLEVRISNVAAINLYNNFNFKKIGIRKNFYSNPKEDALIYTLYLE